ncbi:MAG: AI-2E family transporter [Alphaproteobacteria bacterium]|nr:AI-2E family transporter [Alphaproteobacteria bacterium]
MAKKSGNNWFFWLSVFTLFCIFVYATRSVIMPFVAGILIGYLFDPLVLKLQKFKLNRTLATCLIIVLIVTILVPSLIILIKIINEQIIKFIHSLPHLVTSLKVKVDPILANANQTFPFLTTSDVVEYVNNNVANSVKFLGSILKKIISGGFAFVNIISLLIITPVVAFYMLRDWTLFSKKIDDLLPVKSRNEIRTVAKQIDNAIAGFIRGQLSVCVILGLFYSTGLYFIGLQLGVLVGFVAGLISFIPYIGTISGFVTSIIIALIQFDSVIPTVQVICLFAFGQILEGSFLTPKLVGDSVGLHPVWIMFSLLAGGVLLGFLGIMIAVPIAAIIGVLTRHFITKYKASQIYKG